MSQRRGTIGSPTLNKFPVLSCFLESASHCACCGREQTKRLNHVSWVASIQAFSKTGWQAITNLPFAREHPQPPPEKLQSNLCCFLTLEKVKIPICWKFPTRDRKMQIPVQGLLLCWIRLPFICSFRGNPVKQKLDW